MNVEQEALESKVGMAFLDFIKALKNANYGLQFSGGHEIFILNGLQEAIAKIDQEDLEIVWFD